MNGMSSWKLCEYIEIRRVRSISKVSLQMYEFSETSQARRSSMSLLDLHVFIGIY